MEQHTYDAGESGTFAYSWDAQAKAERMTVAELRAALREYATYRSPNRMRKAELVARYAEILTATDEAERGLQT